MPRKARIDAPGAVHHLMVPGIERRKIFGASDFVDAVLKASQDELGRQADFHRQGYDFNWLVGRVASVENGTG